MTSSKFAAPWPKWPLTSHTYPVTLSCRWPLGRRDVHKFIVYESIVVCLLTDASMTYRMFVRFSNNDEEHTWKMSVELIVRQQHNECILADQLTRHINLMTIQLYQEENYAVNILYDYAPTADNVFDLKMPHFMDRLIDGRPLQLTVTLIMSLFRQRSTVIDADVVSDGCVEAFNKASAILSNATRPFDKETSAYLQAIGVYLLENWHVARQYSMESNVVHWMVGVGMQYQQETNKYDQY